MKNLAYIFSWLFVGAFATTIIPTSLFAQQNKVVHTYQNQKEITANGSITFTPGFNIVAGTTFKAYISPAPGAANNTQLNPLMNSVVTYSVRAAGIIDPEDPNNGINQVNVEVKTLDNFGRLKEIQAVKASGNGLKDIMTIKEYDGMGTESKEYKPYPKATGSKNFSDKGSPQVQYPFWYYPDSTKDISATQAIPWTYSESVFENSPLRRIKEKSSFGQTLSSGHTTRMGLSASSEVAKYTASVTGPNIVATLSRVGAEYYDGLVLRATFSKDENVTGTGGTIYDYINLDGQLILKRRISVISGVTQFLSTYYVYDDLGNLRFVLPPKSEPDVANSITPAVLENLCYQYIYDDQNRMTGKKVPGKGWEYMVYNKLGQLVMTQDAVQRAKSPQEWSFLKYDAQGRTIISGIFAHTGSTAGTSYLSTMQNNVNLQGKYWENRISTGNGYTAVTYPTTWPTTLSLTYYDTYDFPGGNPYPYLGSDMSTMTRGLVTATKTNVLGTSDMLWSVSYYDEDGKVIKAFKQHYKGNTFLAGNYDEISSTYDFTGAVLSSTRSHKVSGSETLKTFNEYEYDHLGRKINSWQQINTEAKILLAKNTYDDFGLLYKKSLHSTNNGLSFLENIKYRYNIRGWLLGAKAGALDMNLRYDSPSHESAAQYNGNISEVEYTGNYSGNKYFKYSYDDQNRLINSDYSDAGKELSEQIAYDKAGNITSLKRGASTNAAISYSYTNGNQLSSVTGSISGSFTYDANGSAITDGTRQNTIITYNQLNLPSIVSKNNGASTANYVYDASGAKLRSVQGLLVRDYVSGIQYNGSGVIDFIATEEGRAVRNTNGTYRYEYNLKDNLGNVRVTIDNNGGLGRRVVQEDEYYAFGLNKNRFTSGDKNNYLYNGKESQDVLSNELDYGARFYDPAIARWHVIDPLAELGRRWSPYTYTNDNPIRFIDPDGMWAVSSQQDGDNPVDKKSKEKKKKEQTGSYTNTHATGKKYHGKGPESRARASGKRVGDANDDPVVSSEWTPAVDDRQAFKDEDDRLRADGGSGSDTNYNERESPGAKYKEEDKKKSKEKSNPLSKLKSEEPDQNRTIIQKRFEFPQIAPPPPGTAVRTVGVMATLTVISAFLMALW